MTATDRSAFHAGKSGQFLTNQKKNTVTNAEKKWTLLIISIRFAENVFSKKSALKMPVIVILTLAVRA